jgi:hypothetical protein
MKSSKKLKIFICFVIMLIGLIVLLKNTALVKAVTGTEHFRIGIIDGSLSGVSEKVNIIEASTKQSRQKTHGDKLIAFANAYTKGALSIFYYDAMDDNMYITSEKIIDGLEWMIRNRIGYVDISLSTKVYSKSLDHWISGHKNQIRVFASYNNLRNTKDYPAMYKDVTASGYDNGIRYRAQDYRYQSNVIVLLPGMEQYKGNSFLSVMTMIDSIRRGKD